MSVFPVVIVACVLLFILAVPLALGRVGPNALYGFRTQRTLSDPAVWYPANAYAGRALMKAAAASVLLECTLWWIAARGYVSSVEGAWGSLMCVIAPLAIAVLASFRHLRTL